MNMHTQELGQAYAEGYADGFNDKDSRAKDFFDKDEAADRQHSELIGNGFCRAYNAGRRDGLNDRNIIDHAEAVGF
jgi:hypothetical protein